MTGTANLYHIYYGDFSSNSSQQTIALVDYFAANLGASPWWGMTSLYYYQTILGVTTYAAPALTFVKSITTASTLTAGDLTMTDSVNAISNAIAAGDLPADPNALYAFFFPGQFTYTKTDGNWLDFWCGFHTSFNYKTSAKSTVNLKYMVIGDPSQALLNGGNCAVFGPGTSANGNWGGDAMVNLYAHEATETVTDAYAAWNYNHPGAVNIGDENADLCSWTFGQLHSTNNSNVLVGDLNFLVQQNWVPTRGCKLYSPPF
jgi:hypothetical protein